MNYEGVCFYLSIFLAGGDAHAPSYEAGGAACVPGQYSAGRETCVQGNYEGGGNMEPAKDN